MNDIQIYMDSVRETTIRDAPRMVRDRTWCKNRRLSRNRMELETMPRIETLLEKLDAPKVLEIGCGKCNVLRNLYEDFPNAELYGIDLLLDASSADLTDIPNLHLMEQDVHSLSFDNNTFDVAFSFFTFPYVADKLKAVSEVHRTLKVGGKAYIMMDRSWTEPNFEVMAIPEPDIEYSVEMIIIKKTNNSLPFSNWTFDGGKDYENCFFKGNISKYRAKNQ
jgi:SAM-dependent methyltransferase